MSLGKNIKSLRMQKGMTQESLANAIFVTRQTISKWEKDLSVPDAEMIVRIADTFNTTVNSLLGSDIENEADSEQIAEQLSLITEELAMKNRRTKTIIRVVLGIAVAGIVLYIILFVLAGLFSFDTIVNP